MKKYIYLLPLLLMFSCDSDDQTMKFSLDIKNDKIDCIVLNEVNNKEHIFIDSIYRKQWVDNNKLIITKPGYYFLSIEKKRGVPLYIQPGFNVSITLSGFNRFSYSGKGSTENEYLLRNKYHPFKNKNYKRSNLKPDQFIKNLDIIFSPFFDLIGKKYKKNTFWELAYKEQLQLKLEIIKEYCSLQSGVSTQALELNAYIKDIESELKKTI